MADKIWSNRRGSSVSITCICLIVLVSGGEQWTVEYKERVKEMFHHAYNGYLQHAYPLDELCPVTCTGADTWGRFSLTLVDALDTLLVMGNTSEFRRSHELLIAQSSFNIDVNTSVFEANIRVVGGLLSAHLLSPIGGVPLAPGWPCEGPLLNMAESLARRLLPAFKTPTGLPYGTVNLRYGVPPRETTVTCTACCSSFIVEFGTLSRLTGDPVFEETAMNAVKAIWKRRSKTGFVGNHIDVITGKWTAVDFSTGNYIDSFLEYLVKGSALLGRRELSDMFTEISSAIFRHTNHNGWYVWVNKDSGKPTFLNFEALNAYWPGLLTMVGELSKARQSHMNHFSVWKMFGALPEIFSITESKAFRSYEAYRLRPELAEAAWYLYQATGNPLMLEVGRSMVESINRTARTSCGFATVKSNTEHTLADRMESYFLAETLKYLYLLFDSDSFLSLKPTNTLNMTDLLRRGGAWHLLHNSRLMRDGCSVGRSGYVFTTEAHPIDVGALHCCKHKWIQRYDQELNDNGISSQQGCPVPPFSSRLELYTATL